MENVEDIDWAKEINDLFGEDLPEKGLSAPYIEKLPKKIPALEDKGDFSKLTTEVYFFVDSETGKVFTMQKHWLTEFGEVTMRQCLKKIKKDTKQS